MPSTTPPFHSLTPALVMDAVERCGFRCDHRVFGLNSYENRVYQVGIENEEPLIVKFYRPQRWTDAQILEEHQFCLELAEHDLPVIIPWRNQAGQSLFHFGEFRLALYPRLGGRAPEFDNLSNLRILGRLLGRIHRIGSLRPFVARPTLDCESFGRNSADLISNQIIPQEHKRTYDLLTDELLAAIEEIMTGSWRNIRTHGDCHAGNIIWRNQAPYLVDFDDARMAPAAQDIWMMLSGERSRQLSQLAEIVAGYNEFLEFPPAELQLIEALRTLRMLHYSAWLARRWNDPTFPAHFPWFNQDSYWREHLLNLREQLTTLFAPPLQLFR